MGERKVLNKYFPQDFDSAKIPRRRIPKNQQIKVRTMLPVSIQCTNCATFIGRGTKFNSRKEDVIGEKYLGIEVLRFYIKCQNCSSDIIIKTDPTNSDYVVESGAKRQNSGFDKDKGGRDNNEDIGDLVKRSENRRTECKREMEVYAALDELRSMNSRRASISVDKLLDDLQHSVSTTEGEDESVIQSLFEGSRMKLLRRITDDDISDEYDSSVPSLKRRRIEGNFNDGYSKKTNMMLKTSAVRVSFVKKVPASKKGDGLQCLCQQYSSDEDD